MIFFCNFQKFEIVPRQIQSCHDIWRSFPDRMGRRWHQFSILHVLFDLEIAPSVILATFDAGAIFGATRVASIRNFSQHRQKMRDGRENEFPGGFIVRETLKKVFTD